MALQHLRSSTADKRPDPTAMADGQLAVNTNSASTGLFFKNSAGALVKVGPVHVGTTAPNATPAAGGTAGNSVGEQWLDTTGGTYVFKVWDGSAWRSESGTFVDVNGDVMTGALGIIAGTAAAPGLYVSGDTNTGIYSPGANQLALSTNGTGRLFVDASGNVKVENTATNPNFAVVSSDTGTSTLGLGDGTNNFAGSIAYNNNTNAFTLTRAGVTSYTSQNDHVYYTSGTEKLRIDSSGRLLVGTSSARATRLGTTTITPPVQTLDGGNGGFFVYNNVAGANPATIYAAKSRGNDYTSAVQNGDSLFRISAAGADGTQATEAASITIAVDGTPGADDMPGRIVLSTTADGASSPTERLRITSAGLVGIGTSSPSGNLHVSTSGRTLLRLTGAGSNTSSSSCVFETTDAGSNFRGTGCFYYDTTSQTEWFSGRPYNGSDAFAVNRKTAVTSANVGDTTAARTNTLFLIDSSGRVGIGTTSPAEALGVAGNTILDASNANLKIKAGTTGTTGAVNFTFNTDSTVYGGLDLNYDNRATIGVRLFAAASNYPVTIESHSGAHIAFRGSTTERARIDSSGRLLVGTSSAIAATTITPGFQHHSTTTDGTAGLGRWTNDTNGYALYFAKSRGTSVGSQAVVNNGDFLGALFFEGSDGTALKRGAGIAAIVDGTPGANSMPGRIVLSTTPSGSATPVERMRISSTGEVTCTSTISDLAGNVRAIPQNSQSASYTLVASDAGKHVDITTGGVTVPSGVFSVGDAITIYNDSTSNQTITQGASVTLRQAGTANTGNRTLAQYGIATVLCVASNTFVITGAGLS